MRVLGGVDLELRAGEVLALMGENGAGKTTLVKILSRRPSRHEGLILIDGAPVRLHRRARRRAAGIAIIHQELNLVPELSAADNIFLGREPLRLGLLARPAARCGGRRSCC